MVCTGHWGGAKHYDNHHCGARQNDYRPAYAMFCTSPLFFASTFYLWRTAQHARRLLESGAAPAPTTELADAPPKPVSKRAFDEPLHHSPLRPQIDDADDDDDDDDDFV